LAGVLDKRSYVVSGLYERAVLDSDRVEGKLKEVEGDLTGEESRKREGQAQGAVGEAKDKASGAWEKSKEVAGDAKDKASDLIEDAVPGDSDQDGH
jgi:uncharacterized protein YjbJ (UPF0337 family)